jgi:hypothetical protein
LNPDLDFQIFGNRCAREWLHKYEERACTYIRMRPQRNYAGTNFVVLNDREGWAVVGPYWHGPRQSDQARKTEDLTRDCLAVHKWPVCQNNKKSTATATASDKSVRPTL